MRGRLDLGICFLALTAAHCGGGGAKDAGLALRLAAVTPELTMKPSESALVAFVLTDSRGEAVANEVVSFSLSVQNGQDARGATLATDTAVTDANGTASTKLNAGLPVELRVTARAPQTEPAVALVWVSTDPVRSVEVAPFLASGATGEARSMTGIDVLFFDSSSCALAAAPGSQLVPRPVRTIAPAGVTRFEYVSAAQRHAVLAQGRDANGRLVAAGCLDLEGVVLSPDAAVRVWVPLTAPGVTITGSFAIQSTFRLPDGAAISRAIAAPWTDLSDCPLDPAQRWLDCTIDALGTDDPLDCEPSDSEGALAESIEALRGPAAQTTGCRAATTDSGAASLDAQAAALFPAGAGRPVLLTSLPALGSEALELLGELTFQSLLELRPTLQPGALSLTHTFATATLTAGGRSESIALQPLGLPVLSAFGTASMASGGINLDQHGITLRPGTVARAGFSALVLTPRSLPTTTADLVATLLAAASKTSAAATLTGCAALDALVCERLGLTAGCIAQACDEGGKALVQRLEEGFHDADGDSLDLLVAGSAPVLDQDGDLLADHLGYQGTTTSSPGLWSAELRSRSGKTAFSGVWTGTRK